MIAVVAEPGMPSVSIGTIAAVAAALLADSGPATPSIAPRPNSSGCFETFFSTRVRQEGDDRRAGAGQDADQEAEHRAARDRPAAAAPSPATSA